MPGASHRPASIGPVWAMTQAACAYSQLDQINRENVRQLKPSGRITRVSYEMATATRSSARRSSSTASCMSPPAACGSWRWMRHRPTSFGSSTHSKIVPFRTGRPRAASTGAAPTGRMASLTESVASSTARPTVGCFHSMPRPASSTQVLAEGGIRNLRDELDPAVAALDYGPTSAPVIWKDTIIVGVSCGEGPAIAAPGDIRAFDVHTGRQLWRFRTVPAPGEFGNDSWAAESWKNRGGANAWGGFSVDVGPWPRVRRTRVGGVRLLRRRPPRRESLCQLHDRP